MRRAAVVSVLVTAILAMVMPTAWARQMPAPSIDRVAVVSVGPILQDGCGPYCIADVRVTVTWKGSYVLEVYAESDGTSTGWASRSLRGSGPRAFDLSVAVPAGTTATVVATVVRYSGPNYEVLATAQSPTVVTCPA